MEERRSKMNWRRELLLAIGIVEMCFLTTTALAQDLSEFILLKGLKGVSVFVQPLDSSVELENLNQSKIRMDIEQKLRSAGIKVLTPKEWVQEIDRPILNTYLMIHKFPQENIRGFIYQVHVGLAQQVMSLRDPAIVQIAETWSTGYTGTTPDSQTIREKISELVDRFINTYLSVNPKR
jgi:hypothetical protein